MRRRIAYQGEPTSIDNPSTTENPSKDSCRRGKWLLRSTKNRQARENNEAIVKPPVSKPLKRKRSTPSPTPLAHSFTSENSVNLKNNDSGKFRDKPIDHRNMLEELLEGSLANGAFANPSVNGGSSSEEDRQKYGPPKTVRRGDVMSSGGKRKSEGSGGSVMKQKKGEPMHEAYDRVAIANERKAQFYEILIANTVGLSSSSIDVCIAALALVQPFVDEKRYWKAYSLFCGPGGGDWRQGFMRLPPEMRIEWVRNLNIKD